MADDPLAEALADLAPDVDVSASWATTGRTIRRRRRRQVAGLVVAGCLVAVASVSVALARPDGDGVDLAIYVPTPTTTPVPDELTITCDGGVGSLSTDVVQTNPAGVRVTIDGGEAGGTVVVVAEAEPDDATVFLRLAPRASGGRPVSGDGSSYPPGRFEVRCGSLEDGDLSDSSPPVWFEVIDLGGNYGYRWSEPCVNATRTFVFVAPDELEAALVDTFGPSARVVPSGYRAASPAQLVVLVDDEPVGSAIEFPDRAQYLVMRCE